jgi:hypothetical protein
VCTTSKLTEHTLTPLNTHRHMDLATDPTLSEDAHFVLSVPWPASKADVLHYIGIADGVGSWRGLGVDPR